MFEDPAIELGLFAPGARVFSIASAGCTAFALARGGCRVTAVDINPAQIEYVRHRMEGGRAAVGAADRIMGLGRRMLPAIGWRRAALAEFLMMDDPDRQARYWRDRLDTRRARLAMSALLSPRRLRLFYRNELLRGLPDAFPSVVRERLARGFATHSNRHNPHAWRLLLGCDPPGFADDPPVRLAAVHCADAAGFLESLPRDSFDGFTLSNILDGVEAGYGARLMAAIRGAAAPGAAVVLRSFGEPATGPERALAAADRAPIWGSVRVETLG
jgi:S-adenosylmethionine:diacylglycerol 3-amino-3-carboxypropyl transferase